MDTSQAKDALKKVWHFIWEDDSIWSWIVNIILAFVIIKFIVYPGLGWIFGTPLPIVAVVSESMEHTAGSNLLCGKRVIDYNNNIENYWQVCGDWYEQINISKNEFESFPFKNGFNKGDLMILFGAKPENIRQGDVIVYRAQRPDLKPDPIIHRVILKWSNNSEYYFQTKGDNNPAVINDTVIGEAEIGKDRILGRAVLRVPLLGYVKIIFVQIINMLKIW